MEPHPAEPATTSPPEPRLELLPALDDPSGEEAESEFRALVELSPADDWAHWALGRALANQGRREEAAPHFKLARALGPRDVDLD